MYVCICNAIREAEIREAARLGAGTAPEAYAQLDCTPLCTQCAVHLQEILDEENRRTAPV